MEPGSPPVAVARWDTGGEGAGGSTEGGGGRPLNRPFYYRKREEEPIPWLNFLHGPYDYLIVAE